MMASYRERWLDLWGDVADDLDGVAEEVERQIAGHYDTLNWYTDLADNLHAAMVALGRALSIGADNPGGADNPVLLGEIYQAATLVNAVYVEVNVEDQGEGAIAVSAHDLEATQRELAEIIEAARQFAKGRGPWG
jgi:hypothetical protein